MLTIQGATKPFLKLIIEKSAGIRKAGFIKGDLLMKYCWRSARGEAILCCDLKLVQLTR